MYQYILVRASSIRALESKLNKHAEKGFVNQGGIIQNSVKEFTVMMRRETKAC